MIKLCSHTEYSSEKTVQTRQKLPLSPSLVVQCAQYIDKNSVLTQSSSEPTVAALISTSSTMCTLVQYIDKTLFSHRVLKRAKGSMRQHAQLRAIKPTGDRQYLAHGNGHLSSQPAVSLGIASSISSPKSLIQFPRIERRTLSRIVRRWPVGLVLLWHQTLVSWLLLIAIASVTSSRLQQCLATTQNPPSCAGFVSSLNANLTGQRPLLPGRGAKNLPEFGGFVEFLEP